RERRRRGLAAREDARRRQDRDQESDREHGDDDHAPVDRLVPGRRRLADVPKPVLAVLSADELVRAVVTGSRPTKPVVGIAAAAHPASLTLPMSFATRARLNGVELT